MKMKSSKTGNRLGQYLLLVISVMLLSGWMTGCTPSETVKEEISREKFYFDLESVVKQDIDTNTTNHLSENKTVIINGRKETKKIDTVDWKLELQPIADADINRAAWKGKFLADTLDVGVAGRKTIQYRALSADIPVQSMRVDFENNQVYRVSILKKINSMLFTSIQYMDYYPRKGFIIRSEQKAFIINSLQTEIAVDFVKK